MLGMSRSTRAASERLQPYHRKKDPPLANLWRLEEFSNIDKHEHFQIIGAVGIRSRFGIIGAGFNRLSRLQPIFCQIEKNAILGHYWGEFDLDSGLEAEANIIPEVMFNRRSEARSAPGESVFLTLMAIHECIIFWVLAGLTPEIQRLFPEVGIKVRRGPKGQHQRIPALFSSAEMGGRPNTASTGNS